MTRSLLQVTRALAAGEVDAATLTEQALSAIGDTQGEGQLTFTRLYAQEARAAAAQADKRRLEQRPRSPLDGVPISIKDLFDVAGEPTTAGSRVLCHATAASKDAAVVARLRQAGAVIVGKTNMTEFAYSGLGVNPHYGTPANAFDRAQRRIPGGSSSGAAVSVSDGMCFGAVGTDTGGSVRIPAALSGLTGYKPTARRIDRAGVLPLSPALDAVGVIAHDVRSCLLLDSVIADTPLLTQEKSLRHARFALPQSVVLEGLDAGVETAWHAALDTLRQAGATLEWLPMEEFNEVAGFNAGGGFTALESWQWHRTLIEQNAAQYDQRVLSRIRRGAELTANDRQLLERQRADWQCRVAQRLNGYDAMLMPTVPVIAPTIAELEADEAHYFALNGAMLRNPSLINFLDGCAVSLPCHTAGQAPVGLMLAGLPLHDNAVMSWALCIEHALAHSHTTGDTP
ncbi:hypothetical protein PMPD1_1886 [Paramixta manurensis]|uniref:Amidase domain-containing protein n=1 Tax=Paramixta manurensis TaxID=2740817 RepID=A0A6M8U7V1_9GAMM|nr:hypothetical protein PMPD1_1886 [Erwiniaceae bacterium PD-1]